MNNGIKPVNKTIDALSFITLLTNVPLAIYDANKINKILLIKKLTKSEKIFGIDNKEHELIENDLVVTDNSNILSIAGIMGNKDFGIDQNTTDAIIEFANFN